MDLGKAINYRISRIINSVRYPEHGEYVVAIIFPDEPPEIAGPFLHEEAKVWVRKNLPHLFSSDT